MAGPAWIKPDSTQRVYLDRYYLGWLDLSHLRPIDKNGLRRLLIADIGESRSEGDPLNVLSDVPDRVNANDRYSRPSLTLQASVMAASVAPTALADTMTQSIFSKP